MILKELSFILSFMLLLIGLLGCQQNSEGESHNNNISKQNEEPTNKTANDNFDIVGIVTVVNSEHKRVLLDLRQKIQEDEEQLWVAIGENTKIFNENEELLYFENLKPDTELKANLSDECLEPGIRICNAKEIVIQ
jgi:hypothetical protein